MTGTEAQRRMSSRLLASVLAAQALAAALGVASAAVAVEIAPVGPAFLGLAFTALFVVASSAALLEWRRHVHAERFAMLAGALGAPLTMIAMLAGWWAFTPAIGVSTLSVFLALAWRFAVRNGSRHRDPTFAS